MTPETPHEKRIREAKEFQTASKDTGHDVARDIQITVRNPRDLDRKQRAVDKVNSVTRERRRQDRERRIDDSMKGN